MRNLFLNKHRVIWIIPIALIIFSILAVRGLANPSSRLSCVVSLIYQGDITKIWLNNPSRSFVEAWVMFPQDLGENVIFGLDQELLESKPHPITFPGADWMGLVGTTRGGIIWIASGTDQTSRGKPSSARNWKIIDSGMRLRPLVWYKLRTTADFSTRKFVSFSVTGPDVDKTFDLSEYSLDYPNYIPFDQRSIGYYLWSMYGNSLGDARAKGKVYFDDLRAGFIAPNGREDAVITSSFENMPEEIPNEPASAIRGPDLVVLREFKDRSFYLENKDARARCTKTRLARTGASVLECDATLRSGAYQNWLKSRDKDDRD